MYIQTKKHTFIQLKNLYITIETIIFFIIMIKTKNKLK